MLESYYETIRMSSLFMKAVQKRELLLLHGKIWYDINGLTRLNSNPIFYFRIAWRQLQATLTEQDYNIIEAFVAKTLGKGFDITVDKLFTFKTVLRRSA